MLAEGSDLSDYRTYFLFDRESRIRRSRVLGNEKIPVTIPVRPSASRALHSAMSIPKDLHDFLSKPSNRKLALSGGEISEVTFFAPEELNLRTFTVDSFDLYLNGPLETDPQEQREYEGYSLIQECSGYSPEGVLTWFPGLDAYGSWDCDHLRIIIYPGVSWTDIVPDPTWFINGQWYPDRVPHKEVNPWL